MDMNALKQNGLSFQQLKNMNTEERKAFIRHIIEERDSNTKAVLFDVQHQRTISIFEMADEMGIDKTVDFINNLIDSSKCHAQTMTGDELYEAIGRMRSGNATEEEENLVHAFMDSMLDTDAHKFYENLIEIVIDLVNFAQQKVGYEPTLGDIYNAISAFSIVNMTLDKNCGLHKYFHKGPEVVSEIGIQVGEDIYNSWKATLTEEPDLSIVLAGLLFLTSKIARQAGYKIVSAKDIAELLDYKLEPTDDENCECNGHCEGECECHHENENGSNKNIVQPVIPFSFKNEDQDMRDILKD